MTKITDRARLFAIGDLHLPGGSDKPMDVFGAHWEGHFEKISADWLERVGQTDIVLIPGDISWAMHLSAARGDLDAIGRLPGKKILIRGNHDYWWNSISRLRMILPEGMYALQNDALSLDGYVFCGSRGWSQPDSEADLENQRIYRRELTRMELSLQRGRALKRDGEPLIVLTHYPPVDHLGRTTPMTELFEHYDEIKMWYDGYRFGNVEVYCPWDVINYCDELRINNMAQPQNYWSNTSSNEAVKRFIQETDKGTVRKEIEKLIAGETIVKEIHQELTYQDMYASIENLWSVLFTTGYLTQTGRKDANTFMLTIPNMEIRNIFLTQIMEYFKKTVSENGEALEKFCNALKDGNSEVVEQSLNNYLKRTISIRDTFVKKQMKENFYHGILLGILGFQQNWSVSSNKESGDGYSDILIETEDQETGIIIEIKYAETGTLEAVSEEALKQIEDRRYKEQLLEEGVEHILKYGIAFYKKKCKVMAVK